jgi:DNA helicase-2/ATP-dependent DNA helicase PcrA
LRLNAQQQAAVDHGEGPLLVLAGAGSGKTRVIAARIERLLAMGTEPGSILAVTFTNRAADEMRERIATMVGHQTAKALWLSTFHSFGVRFVREEAEALNLGSRFTILDQGDSLGLVRQLLRARANVERNLDAQAILSRISLWKNALLKPERVRAKDDEYEQAASSIYGAYESALADMHAVDFDDLVIKPVILLRDRPGVRRKWRDRFAHILVDEFQDTNVGQLALIRLLLNERGNVCVVGDDDQSIYGWRGACIDNILDFEKHFPGAVVTKLEHNYRSRASILAVANSAIQGSTRRRYPKTLKPVRQGGSRVRHCFLPEPQDEARFVASEIRRLEKEGMDPGVIAVLYRSNTQAKLLEEELGIAGVSYRVFGGTKFFDRKEIKDCIAYLRVALNPSDVLSLRRIINTPPRGLGDQSLRQIAEHAEAHAMSLFRALRSADRIEALSPRAAASALGLAEAIETAGKGFRSGALAAPASSLMRSVGMLQEQANPSPEAQKRRVNVEFLIRSIERLEARNGADRNALQQLLHHLALDPSDTEEPQIARQVTLSSLHSAKGLEFACVFLVGCVEGMLPHARTTDPRITDVSVADVEEERRLFYVGVTRARELLYLTGYEQRVTRGRLVKITPSRFLRGLPETDIESYRSPESRELERHEVAEMAKALLERLGANDA